MHRQKLRNEKKKIAFSCRSEELILKKKNNVDIYNSIVINKQTNPLIPHMHTQKLRNEKKR